MAETQVQVADEGKDETTKDVAALIKQAGRGDGRALAALRERLASRPQVWHTIGDVGAHARGAWLKLSAGENPVVAEGVERRLAALREELLGERPSPLERLPVERIVVCWLQLSYAEHRLALLERDGGAMRQGEDRQRGLERAERRYQAAIRSLAQVRRLLSPAVQLNIAEKQINVAG